MVIGWDDSIFITGHDTETTLAVIILLFELMITLAIILVFLLLHAQIVERIIEKSTHLISEPGFIVLIPDASPPLPLRI
jgi:hypothetical protein